MRSEKVQIGLGENNSTPEQALAHDTGKVSTERVVSPDEAQYYRAVYLCGAVKTVTERINGLSDGCSYDKTTVEERLADIFGLTYQLSYLMEAIDEALRKYHDSID